MKPKLKNLLPYFATIGTYNIPQPPGLLAPLNQGGALAFIISRFFTFVLPLVGILGFLFFLWSGFQFLTSKGDPKALAAAQARLTYAIIGLIIVFLTYALTAFFTGLFGLKLP
ncbi:MAG: pilin [bacterium]|nr:pilin [bacterium]